MKLGSSLSQIPSVKKILNTLNSKYLWRMSSSKSSNGKLYRKKKGINISLPVLSSLDERPICFLRLDAAWAVISHSEMKEGYGNVCDEPGETWLGLASTFTQKWINLFNHPELPLCIPDEAEQAKLCLLGVAVIWRSLNMFQRVRGSCAGTFWRWLGRMLWTWSRLWYFICSCDTDLIWNTIVTYYPLSIQQSGN